MALISNPNASRSVHNVAVESNRPTVKISVHKSKSHSRGGGSLALFVTKGWKLTDASKEALRDLQYENIYTGEARALDVKWSPATYQSDGWSIYLLGPAHSVDFPAMREAITKFVEIEPAVDGRGSGTVVKSKAAKQVVKKPAPQQASRRSSKPVVATATDDFVEIDGEVYRKVGAVEPSVTAPAERRVFTAEDIIIG